MPHPITRDTIVRTALKLIEDKQGIQGVNLREIARMLGCAHTNLYNYFGSFEEILWRALDTAVVDMAAAFTAEVGPLPRRSDRVRGFLQRILSYYLDHPGWFRLVWQERWSAEQPSWSIENSSHITRSLTEYFAGLLPRGPGYAQSLHLFHTVHCYLYGEAALFIAGRRFLNDRPVFESYVLGACMKLVRCVGRRR